MYIGFCVIYLRIYIIFTFETAYKKINIRKIRRAADFWAKIRGRTRPLEVKLSR